MEISDMSRNLKKAGEYLERKIKRYKGKFASVKYSITIDVEFEIIRKLGITFTNTRKENILT
jgi:hypothetical protein